MGSQEMARERFGSEIGKGEKAQGHTMQEPLDRHPGRSLAVNAVPSQMVPPPKKKDYLKPLRERFIICIQIGIWWNLYTISDNRFSSTHHLKAPNVIQTQWIRKKKNTSSRQVIQSTFTIILFSDKLCSALMREHSLSFLPTWYLEHGVKRAWSYLLFSKFFLHPLSLPLCLYLLACFTPFSSSFDCCCSLFSC